jgi:hypothetical protein
MTGRLATVPTIAVVDSGVQARRLDFDFGECVVKQVGMVDTGTPNAAGDGYGPRRRRACLGIRSTRPSRSSGSTE